MEFGIRMTSSCWAPVPMELKREVRCVHTVCPGEGPALRNASDSARLQITPYVHVALRKGSLTRFDENTSGKCLCFSLGGSFPNGGGSNPFRFAWHVAQNSHRSRTPFPRLPATSTARNPGDKISATGTWRRSHKGAHRGKTTLRALDALTRQATSNWSLLITLKKNTTALYLEPVTLEGFLC